MSRPHLRIVPKEEPPPRRSRAPHDDLVVLLAILYILIPPLREQISWAFVALGMLGVLGAIAETWL